MMRDDGFKRADLQMQIRFATSGDYKDVARLVSQIHRLHVVARPDMYVPFDSPMSAQYYEKLLRGERTNVIVAEDLVGKAVVAYAVIRMDEAAYRPIFQQRKYIYIDDLCVDEAHRRRGIGRQMFSFIVDYAREISASFIELGVAEFNQDAIQFYESLGMVTRSRKMEYMVNQNPRS